MAESPPPVDCRNGHLARGVKLWERLQSGCPDHGITTPWKILRNSALVPLGSRRQDSMGQFLTSRGKKRIPEDQAGDACQQFARIGVTGIATWRITE